MDERDRAIHVAMVGARGQLVVAFAVLMAFGWWVTAQPPFSVAATVGVLISGATLIVLARLWRRQDAAPVSDDSAEANQRIWLWVVLLVALLVWELISFLGHPREAHPTISSITDSMQAEHVFRWLFFGGWLAIGWSLAA
jgi:hypothetical protein